jgi:hypothetical protein
MTMIISSFVIFAKDFLAFLNFKNIIVVSTCDTRRIHVRKRSTKSLFLGSMTFRVTKSFVSRTDDVIFLVASGLQYQYCWGVRYAMRRTRAPEKKEQVTPVLRSLSPFN